jgi:succinate dehydrogenase / fumarate reductase iron-sulfur subunit
MQFDDTTNCILCASCYSACPVLADNTAFLGTGRHRPGLPLSTPTRATGVRGAPGGTGPCGWRMALPEPFQMHPVLSAVILITKRINQTKRMIEKHKETKNDT